MAQDRPTLQLQRPLPETGPEREITVLVIDPDPSIRRTVAALLSGPTTHVREAVDFDEGQAIYDEVTVDVALIDMALMAEQWRRVQLRAAKVDPIGCRTILLTDEASFEAAVGALRLGAADCLVKPFADPQLVVTAVHRTARLNDLERRNRQLLAELKAANQSLQALAVRDPLTQLYNHGYLQEVLEREIARSMRHKLELALIFIDLDRFKGINDSLGHVVGDRLLQSFSEILRGSGRRSDLTFRLRRQDVAARYGGDEFALLLPETTKQGAAVKAERLREYVEGYALDGAEERMTISIGIASFPRDARDRVGLIEAADSALRVAKRMGRNRLVSYSSSLIRLRSSGGEAEAADVRKLEALESSIARHDFNFVYQPIVDGRSGQVFAYEALCRPRHPEFPDPAALIATAEMAGRVAPLGRALRQKSVRALSVLPPQSLLFVNIHPHELNDPEFVSIEPFLAEWADQIVLELTEVAEIKEYGKVRDIIARLRSAGFRIAIDDLGAGYSGLNSLAMLEPDFVKLDMALVRRLPSDPRTRRLVKHLLEFAADERMLVIAEGVETDEERTILTQLGCPLLQGYLFSEPRPIEDVCALGKRIGPTLPPEPAHR